MAYPIPKIQYKNNTIAGDTTSASGTIANVSAADIALLQTSMVISGTGIPANTTVLTVGTNSFTISNNATATGVAVSLAVALEVSFDFPPKENDGEILENKGSSSESLSGIRQVSTNHIEATRALVFSFLSPTIYALLNSFITNHAVLGNSFRYFEDKTINSYTTYELNSLKVSPKKLAPRSATTYVWEVPLSFRRAL